MSFAPAPAPVDNLERDVSCLGVMGFAAVAVEDESHAAPLRTYFAYYLGRLSAREAGQPWAARSVTNLKQMDAEQMEATLVLCAAMADAEFEAAAQPMAAP